MLGWVLLQIHNHQVLSMFFASVREAIKNGNFEKGKEAFERMYESELPKGTGVRPRARGYHFKSEGKGEPKRNAPAWEALGDGEGEWEGRGVAEGDGDGNGDGSGEGDETPALVPEGNAKELEEKGFAEAVER
jgi:queuine tRNA-ribosyltransferase accessory subunit